MKHGQHTDKTVRLVVALAVLGIILVAADLSVAEAEDDGLPVTGKEDGRLASFDRMMMAFVQKHKVPGATLAVARGTGWSTPAASVTRTRAGASPRKPIR